MPMRKQIQWREFSAKSEWSMVAFLLSLVLANFQFAVRILRLLCDPHRRVLPV